MGPGITHTLCAILGRLYSVRTAVAVEHYWYFILVYLQNWAWVFNKLNNWHSHFFAIPDPMVNNWSTPSGELASMAFVGAWTRRTNTVYSIAAIGVYGSLDRITTH